MQRGHYALGNGYHVRQVQGRGVYLVVEFTHATCGTSRTRVNRGKPNLDRGHFLRQRPKFVVQQIDLRGESTDSLVVKAIRYIVQFFQTVYDSRETARFHGGQRSNRIRDLFNPGSHFVEINVIQRFQGIGEFRERCRKTGKRTNTLQLLDGVSQGSQSVGRGMHIREFVQRIR